MTRRQKAISDLIEYIWSLQKKCDGIVEINRSFIEQYARFAVLADELSVEIEKQIDKLSPDEIDAKLKLYEKLQKTALNLYKVLKFEQIREEMANYGNPFLELAKEAQDDGDF